MKKIALALALLAAAPAGALAQTTPAAPSPSHQAAALEMVEAANMDETLSESLDTMLKLQTEQNPELKPFEDVMRTFFSRYMSWNALRNDYARLYADAFTEAELRELTAFYRSPVGQKVATVTPQLMARASELGQKAVQAHLPELQQMIMERMQRGSGASGGTKP